VIGARELDAAGITDAGLRAGYQRCRRINFEHGKTYFLATLLLPPQQRPYVHALYGFARYADDLVDDVDPTVPVGELRRQVQQWTADVLAELEWQSSSDLVVRALIDTMSRWQIPVRYFADFLESMRMDLTIGGYATFDDLSRYMWGSAAVIGLQMLPILGRADDRVSAEELELRAIDLGMAFQLTNFIRDVGEDLRRGRVYLPQESLDMFGVDRQRLSRGVVDEPIRNLLAWEIERARALYRSAEPGLALVHPTSRDCLTTACTLYEEILDEIERAGYDVFSARVAVGLRRRLQVGAAGLRQAWAARRGVPARPRWSA
jgi:phytoene synthase